LSPVVRAPIIGGTAAECNRLTPQQQQAQEEAFIEVTLHHFKLTKRSQIKLDNANGCTTAAAAATESAACWTATAARSAVHNTAAAQQRALSVSIQRAAG
jgi:hypothetical protein